MKKSLLSLLLMCAACGSMVGQITFMQLYSTPDVAVVNLENNGTMILERQGADYNLYDLNQVLVSTFTPPQQGYVLYFSNTLFNTDPNDIEYMVHGQSDTWIFKLDGTELFHLEGAGPGGMSGGMHYYYDQAITNTENGAIMRLWVEFNEVKLFQLPGCLYEPACSAWEGSNLPGEPGGAAEHRAYPNPTASDVTIPYALPAGAQIGTLELLDMGGQQVRSWQVGPAFSSIRADLSGLPSGTYLTRLTAEGQLVESQKILLVK